jgi:oxygen-independent coproporphyrinogen-3 oxidase
LTRDVFAVDLDRIEKLLPRYAMEGPRYTSYPTAPVWGDGYGPSDFRRDLSRDDAQPGDGLSIYVHVPFCRSLCHFCACNRVITRNEALPVQFLETIEREVDTVREAVGAPRPVTQVHWGGGTPTHLTPEQVTRLHAAVTARFPVAEGAEISIEVDPRVTTPEHVGALREAGFNRISMGVQDFEPRVQEAIHRIQPLDDTAALVDRCRQAGFESVNFDLIYGLPYQSEATFTRTLEKVIALRPDRLALYSYAHVTWVAKHQRGFERKDLPPPEVKIRIFLAALRRFLEAGYRFIGLDHFAEPDDELSRAFADRTLRRNFMGHTTQAGVDLIGLGPSAISELRGAYAQSHREIPVWQEAVESGQLATRRGHVLTPEDLERRWVIGRIMCHGEIRASEFEAAFGRPFADSYSAELASLEPAVDDGLAHVGDDGSLQVTPLGRLLVRNVAMQFDAYLPEQRREGRSMFSKTV